MKRSPQSSNEQQSNQINSNIERAACNSGAGTSGTLGVEQMLPSSLRRRASSPVNLDRGLHVVKEKVRLAVLHEQLGKLVVCISLILIQWILSILLAKCCRFQIIYVSP